MTVTSAEKTYYMLIENASDWQGFYVQPSTERGYAVSSDGLSQISYNRLGNANSWDGYMTNESETYVEGSGYRVRYHAEYNYGMSFLCSRSSVVLCLPLRTSIMAHMPTITFDAFSSVL